MTRPDLSDPFADLACRVALSQSRCQGLVVNVTGEGSDGSNAEDLNAVLELELFDARISSAPFQIIQIQFGSDRQEPGLDEFGGMLVIRALVALKDFIDSYAVIIHESDFPLLHQCLLDQTRKWAYIDRKSTRLNSSHLG